MARLTLPSDAVIWEGPYSAVEHGDRLQLFHAYFLEGARLHEEQPSLCGQWRSKLAQPPDRFRRWGEGAAGMYPSQRWCEDCRFKVQSIRTRMDADALRAFSHQRAGKGRRTPPRLAGPGESFVEHHRTQAQLWIRAIDFPNFAPESAPVDANIDVEWRCTVRGHPTFIEQPKRVHEQLVGKRRPCPLCREGLKPEPWTKARVVAFVRSMGEFLDQLSPADRYQLLLQTGILNSGGAWAAPVAEAVLHGSGTASHAAIQDLVGDLEPESKALDLFRKLRRHTPWPSDETKAAANNGDVRERYARWCSTLHDVDKIEAIRSMCAPSWLRQIETLWRYAPHLGEQPDELRRMLLELFPARGLRLEHIASASDVGGLSSVESLLWEYSARAPLQPGERDQALDAIREEIAQESQAMNAWLQAKSDGRDVGEMPPRRRQELAARMLTELLGQRHRGWFLAHLQGLDAHNERSIKSAVELWRHAPVVGDVSDGIDAFRRLMREALPGIAFDAEPIVPAMPASEAFQAWKRSAFSEIGEARVEEEGDRSEREQVPHRAELPTDQVARILDVSERLLFADYDVEAVDYFLASQVAKLWSIAFDHLDEALLAANRWSGSEFGNQVRDAFLHEAHDVEALPLPDDWAFRPSGVPATEPPYRPRLMQRLTAVRLRNASERGIGNWSLMGGGKTVSAILSSAVLETRLTVVICPNATVDGWCDEIARVFPSAAVSVSWEPPAVARRRFVVLNVEQFQLPDTSDRIRRLIDVEPPQLVVLDEVHKFKQRDKTMTLRREMMLAFLSESAEREPSLKVLGLSGTPVINNLMEARSLIELCTLTRHADLEIAPTLPNAMRVHSRLARLGLRYRPDYMRAFDGIRKVRIDVSDRLERLREAEDRHAAEACLMQEKLGVIAAEAGPRTVVYSELVTEVHDAIGAALRAKGLRVGYFNGSDKAGLLKFKNGEVDVLVASNALGTGVDGLQHCTERLIIATLPWTSSDFDQLLGRFFRPKSDGTVGHAEVVVPWTFLPPSASSVGREWSMDEARWRRIQYKSSLADTAVDGVLPEGELRSPEQAFKDLQTWLVRLETGGIKVGDREPLRVPLPASQRAVVTARVGDLTRFHARLASSRSETTHSLLQNEPEQWAWYHTEVEEAAASWPFRPVERCIEWLRRRAERRKGFVVADVGCGLAKVHAALHTVCEVKSFDHVAYNANVTVANAAAGIPLEDGSVDAVVLSLVLDWQKDWERCLDEVARILTLDGRLLFWETQAFVERVGGAESLASALRLRGLKVIETFDEKFFGIVAIKP